MRHLARALGLAGLLAVGTVRAEGDALAGVRAALQQFGGNKKRVAQELAISRSHLYKKLASMGL